MVAWNDDSEFGSAMKHKARDEAVQASNEMMVAHWLCRVYLMGQYAAYPMNDDQKREAIDNVVQQCWHIWVPTARSILESLLNPDR